MLKLGSGLKKTVAPAVLSLFAAPTAFAGGGVSVVVGAVSSGGGVSVSQPIPTMSVGLMIALAGLLAVVAVRFLRQRGTQQKLMSALLLGGSVALSGVGYVEHSKATDASVPVSSSACSGGVQKIDSGRGANDSSAMLTNNCSIDLEVKEWLTNECPPFELEIPSPVGTVIPAGGQIRYAYCRGIRPT